MDRLISLAACLLLTASTQAQQPSSSRLPDTSEQFSTTITEDGRKQFTYELSIQRPEGGRGALRRGGRRGDAEDRGLRPGRSGMTKEKRAEAARKAADFVDARLEAQLAESGFCREGYSELERRRADGRLLIRGECGEAATAEDRERFGGEA